ncbi:MAG: CHASE2 domain-containing protein [Cyanobacteria bacterium SBLK]|nr:CHASE2 domain-containing protein [Cyanobacteria bacterium SBLK]
MRSVFELKVRGAEGDTCFFLLMWGDRRNDLSATLPYPRELQKRYQRWRQRYFRFYEFKIAPEGSQGSKLPESGSLELLTEDAANNLIEAREGMLDAFLHWLGEGEVRKIQERIWQELTILAQSASKTGEACGIDLFLSCDGELARLPWEAWSLAPRGSPPDTVRLIRTTTNPPEGMKALRPDKRFRKPRILTILGADRRLELEEDLQIWRSLRAIATIETLDWQTEENSKAIKQAIAQTLQDDRGWDILFFAGHSDETQYTGGRLELSPKVSLALGELEESLIQARKNGLRLAIFNSCNGLSIATRLVDLGLQAVVMREPIHNDTARVFLNQFCQQLSLHKNVLEALSSARQYLESEPFAFPSAYLIPSFFSPWNAEPVRIEPYGWKHRLKQLLPTKREAIAVGFLLFMSLLSPVHAILYDLRAVVQAIYREQTRQLSIRSSSPITLVGIDRKSLIKAQIDNHKITPIDRQYLAKLVDKISQLDGIVIGIDYLLDSPNKNEDKFLQVSLRNAIEDRGSWFVFGNDRQLNDPNERLSVTDTIIREKNILQGDISVTYFPYWKISQPAPDCFENCPFSYILALAYTARKNNTFKNLLAFKREGFNDIENQSKEPIVLRSKELDNLDRFQNKSNRFHRLIDFSIPPSLVYQYISASQLLENSSDRNHIKIQERIEKKLVIIIPGGYEQADDNFEVPMAIQYWQWRNKRKPVLSSFVGGEAHAYMVHHWLSRSNWVTLIPTFWSVLVAALLGRIVCLFLSNQKNKECQKNIIYLGVITGFYGIVTIQLYISISTLFPWFLPSVSFWLFIISMWRRKNA